MVYNVSKSTEADITEKYKHDQTNIENILSPLLVSSDKIKKIVRVRKPESRPRPIKIMFKNSKAALSILKQKNKIRAQQVKISCDLTKISIVI